MPPGVPVARRDRRGSEGNGQRHAAGNGACHDRRGKAQRLSKRHDRVLPCPPGWRPQRVKLILDLRAVALELAVHPKTLLVIPDAAGEIGRDERIARGANLAAGDHDLLVGKLACADTDDAAILRVDHRRLLQHRRSPQTVRRQGCGGSDKGTALAHHAKSLRRRRARRREGSRHALPFRCSATSAARRAKSLRNGD